MMGKFRYSPSDIVDIPTSTTWLENQNESICSGFVNSRSLVVFDYSQKQEISNIFSYDSEALDARPNKFAKIYINL